MDKRCYNLLMVYYDRLLHMLLKRYRSDKVKYTKDYIEWRRE